MTADPLLGLDEYIPPPLLLNPIGRGTSLSPPAQRLGQSVAVGAGDRAVGADENDWSVPIGEPSWAVSSIVELAPAKADMPL